MAGLIQKFRQRFAPKTKTDDGAITTKMQGDVTMNGALQAGLDRYVNVSPDHDAFHLNPHNKAILGATSYTPPVLNEGIVSKAELLSYRMKMQRAWSDRYTKAMKETATDTSKVVVNEAGQKIHALRAMNKAHKAEINFIGEVINVLPERLQDTSNLGAMNQILSENFAAINQK